MNLKTYRNVKATAYAYVKDDECRNVKATAYAYPYATSAMKKVFDVCWS